MANFDGSTNVLGFEKLSQTNFRQWKFNIRMFLLNQGLFGFVDKTEPPLEEDASPKDRRLYAARKSKALATICLSIEENLKDLVIDATDPAEVWTDITAVFEPTTRARIASLRMDFMNITMKPTETMSVYLGRLQRAASDLELAGKKIADDELAYHMLGNLSKKYDAVVMPLYQLPDEDFTSKNVREALLAEYDRLQHRDAAASADGGKSAFSSEDRRFGQRQGNSYNRSSKFHRETRICHNCGIVGHLAKHCRKPRRPRNLNDNSSARDSNTAAFYAAAYLSTSDYVDWVVDTAATEHFCNNKELFLEFQELNQDALIAEGTSKVCGMGNVALTIWKDGGIVELLLKNVLFAPAMSRNLISGRLIDEAGYSIYIKHKSMQIKTPRNEIFLNVPLVNKFYVLKTKKKKISEVHVSSNRNDVMLWHARLGHLNTKALQVFSKTNNVSGLEHLVGKSEFCDICNTVKAQRASFKSLNVIQSKNVLELIHMDIWGPAPVQSMGGAKYVLVIIDDFSRYSVVYFLNTKDEAFDCFKQYKLEMENRTEKKIKRIRTDNAMEFCAKYFETFLKEQGIRIERTNVYSPEMNAVAERYNRTLVEGARALLLQGKLPKELWAEAIFAQNHIRNRFPHKSLNGKAPLNVLEDRKISVSYLKVIGCLAYTYIPGRYRDKLENKARKGILVGYSQRTKGYRIWYPGTKTVIETKHVKFNESLLGPHEEVGKTKGNFLNPDYTDIDYDVNASDSEEDDANRETQTVEPNWERVVTKRKSGKSAGRLDIYYYPKPAEVRLRSLNDIKQYCQKKGLKFDHTKFDFSQSSLDAPSTSNDNVSTSDDNPNISAQQESSNDIPRDSNNILENDTTTVNNNLTPEAHCATVIIPDSFHESQELPQKEHWYNAMVDELNMLKKREVYDVVPRPENKRVVGNRWVFTVKKDETGKIQKYKARLVAQGFRQIEGVDYSDTFSPVISFTLVRLFLVLLVILKGWCNRHLDIKNAYLYGHLEEVIFMEQPQGFFSVGSEGNVLRLKKALYGLHQSRRQWFVELDKVFLELGFKRLTHHSCIYVFEYTVVILVYVDDLAIFSQNETVMDKIVKLISSRFDVVDLGTISKFLGIQCDYVNDKVLIHQREFIEKLKKTL